MKKLLSFILMVSFFFAPLKGAKNKIGDLPAQYRKWLKEEVIYIISAVEKDVFLMLDKNRERDTFIEAFWKQRDPTPSSPANEFKTEHYRRINYANRYLGRSVPKPGWKTDRGRIYIILGEPREKVTYAGKQAIYPCEVWWYQVDKKLGLPPGFNLVFFQDGGSGEFRLYSPLADGPQKLLSTYSGDPIDYNAAYKALLDTEPTLAQVSLSLIPGEERVGLGRPSLSSDTLIQKIEESPQRQQKDLYAKKFLEYKDLVEVEYTANYMDSDSLVKLTKHVSGVHFVHYVVELPKLSVDSYEDKHYFTLRLNGTVADSKGKIIYQYEKTIAHEFAQNKLSEISLKPFNLHDMFPLIPGNYKLSVLIRNETSKEFTSFERDLFIPQDDSSVQMTSLLLGYNTGWMDTDQKKMRPFQLGSYRIFCQPNRIFAKADNLAAAFQIHGLSLESRERAELRFTFFKDNEEFRTITKNIREYPDSTNFLQQFPLNDFPPAFYSLRISLMDNGRELLSEREKFAVTYLSSIPRPWIHSRALPDIENSVYSYIIGTQLYNSGKIVEARNYLEKAFQKKPDSVVYGLWLARIYMIFNEYEKTKAVLLPFLNQPEPEYEILFLMGKTHQKLGELNKAINTFDRAISLHGLNTNLLNLIGECYLQLGEKKEALMAWEKSLELNADQPQIKSKAEALKK